MSHPDGNIVLKCPNNDRERNEMQKIPYASIVGSLMYAQRTKGYMLTYWKSERLEIIGYSNFDFARCQDSKRSMFGYIYMLARGAISWKFIK
ncbi:hypothetical protein CR513_27481, partial [Mucuna pruriens]